jgi:uncharacterized SAM-binding protein YcdF (DUF218 family)
VADAAIFEKRGIVSAAIITSPFKLTANSMARRYGFTDYRYAVMPHPIGNLRHDQIRQRAEEVLPQVMAILGLAVE